MGARARGETPEDRVARQRERRKLTRWFDWDDDIACWLLKIDEVTNKRLEARFLAAVNQLLRDRDGVAARTYSNIREIANDQLAADAFVGLLLGEITTAGGPAGIVVITDPTVLDDEPADDTQPDPDDEPEAAAERSPAASIDGVPVPTGEARRLLCDEDLWLTLFGATPEQVNVGRLHRCATAAQRALLRILHPTCGVAHCEVSFDRCQIHHTRFWTLHQGDTDIEHLIPLCSRHHHLVHDQGWVLRLHWDRSVDLCHPDGSIYRHAPPPTPPPGAAVPRRYRHLLAAWLARTRRAA